jgi:hypothetical protein
MDGRIMVVTENWSMENSYDRSSGRDNPTILHQDVGSIDYVSGKIEISRFATTNIADGTNYIYLFVKPAIDDIMPIGNTILTIDSGDIDVTVVDDTNRLPQNKVQGY